MLDKINNIQELLIQSSIKIKGTPNSKGWLYKKKEWERIIELVAK